SRCNGWDLREVLIGVTFVYIGTWPEHPFRHHLFSTFLCWRCHSIHIPTPHASTLCSTASISALLGAPALPNLSSQGIISYQKGSMRSSVLRLIIGSTQRATALVLLVECVTMRFDLGLTCGGCCTGFMLMA